MLKNNDLRLRPCASASVAQKLMYLLIGGGIGAGVALLFAPTSGRELRAGISDVATDVYARTEETAHQLKLRGEEYYEAAKETGNVVLDVVASGMSAVGEEIREDVAKINRAFEGRAKSSMRSKDLL